MNSPRPEGSLVARPEYLRDQVLESNFGVVSKPLGTWERIYGNPAVRKIAILFVLAAMMARGAKGQGIAIAFGPGLAAEAIRFEA